MYLRTQAVELLSVLVILKSECYRRGGLVARASASYLVQFGSFSSIAFFRGPSHLCFTRMISFLGLTNFTKLKRLHRTASRAIIGCPLPSLSLFSSLNRLYLPYESPRLISPCYLMNRSQLVSQLPFPISGLARLE